MDYSSLLKLYGHRIKVHASQSRNSDVIEELAWDKLPFHTYTRFLWYFEYRYAVLRVKYPRNYIQTFKVVQEPTEQFIIQQNRNKIKAKKRKLTEYKNKLRDVVNNWDTLFPIEEDIRYQNTIDKINQLECQLLEMISMHESY